MANPLTSEYIEPLIEELFYAYDAAYADYRADPVTRSPDESHALMTAMSVLTHLIEEGYVE